MEQYILTTTNDNRDRAGEILEKLETYGVCILGSGVFCVSGVKMPDGTTLMGMGACTELLLDESLQSGYAVMLSSRCTVKNMMITGAAEDIDRPTEIGERHGIGFVGTATKENRSGQPGDSMVSGCHIRNFTGGGITCRDTGYGINASLCVSDCRIHYCGAGINISHFSEYHKFNNVVSTRNLYGCVNNGGNNVFTGCGFDGNTLGFLIDNSQDQSPNNAHGSCVACTFNHTNFNKGIGIKIVGSNPGYVFSDCQVFFSEIVVEDAKGIQFNHFNFGRDQQIRIKDGGAVIFSGCIFTKQPQITLEGETKVFFHQCYNKAGDPVTP